MTKHEGDIVSVPTKVKVFGKMWALKYILTHPNWKNEYEDTWTSFSNYDINLYVEEGYLSVCAYPFTRVLPSGCAEVDYSNWATLYSVKG